MPHIPQSVKTPPIVAKVEKVLGPARQGKVRALWHLSDRYLLIVATDRISAFDYVLSDYIPLKGAVLSALTDHWIDVLKDRDTHLIASGAGIDAYLPQELYGDAELRSVGQIVKKKMPAQIECICRGYLTGSGYKDYLKTGEVCGIKLPTGMRDGDRLPEPIFTPSTKADVGHDENITGAQAADIIGWEGLNRLKQRTLELYTKAAAIAMERNIIIADTKFEFAADGCLIDEILTPDSSRFWTETDRVAAINAGKTPPSHDKQFVRDYLQQAGFKDMTEIQRDNFVLPEMIKQRTTGIYTNIFQVLTGQFLRDYQKARRMVAANG